LFALIEPECFDPGIAAIASLMEPDVDRDVWCWTTLTGCNDAP